MRSNVPRSYRRNPGYVSDSVKTLDTLLRVNFLHESVCFMEAARNARLLSAWGMHSIVWHKYLHKARAIVDNGVDETVDETMDDESMSPKRFSTVNFT